MSSVEDESPSSQDTVRKVRKRFKPLKSCAFCRKRKLKCDKKKPRCSSCIRRCLPECLYTENAFTLEMVQSGKVTSMQLLERIRDLEKRLADKQTKDVLQFATQQESLNHQRARMESSGMITVTRQASLPTSQPIRYNYENWRGTNPYLKYNYLQVKQYGRLIYYGPTALRTQVAINDGGFLEKYQQLWSKVKEERQRYKSKHNVSLLRELQTVKYKKRRENENLLEDICADLPSYDSIREVVLKFFEDDETNELNQILDKNKVMKDFQTEFQKGTYQNESGEFLVNELVPDQRLNLYKIGIILMILCLNYYFEDVPVSIENYFVFINGATSGKSMYMERAQFLILQCHHRSIYASRGDHTHLLNILNSLAGLSYTLGLQGDIENLYKEQEHLVGNTKSLQKLWIWILFFDYEISFQTGRPLTIVYDMQNLDYIAPSHNIFDSYYRRMVAFLKIGRPMLILLYDNTFDPPLQDFCDHIYQYIEAEFHSIGNCSDLTLVQNYLINDLRILSMALGSLMSFYILRITIKKDTSPDLIDDTVHVMSISFSLTISLLVRCYNLDRIKNTNFFEPECPHLPPYMALSISVSNNLFARAATVLTLFLYFKFSEFDSGFLFATEGENTYISPGITRDRTRRISLVTSFRRYSEALGRYLYQDNALLMNAISNAYIFIIQISLERIYQVIIQKVIEFRKASAQPTIERQLPFESREYKQTFNRKEEQEIKSLPFASAQYNREPINNKNSISDILNNHSFPEDSHNNGHSSISYNNNEPLPDDSNIYHPIVYHSSLPNNHQSQHFQSIQKLNNFSDLQQSSPEDP
ncbi:Yrr1p RNJ42_01832 [Nakaseomyces bracarensis]|uniref:Yrr1p n=1 Tax=Nakaseomyces bracarensis TaxID=273131 RepID=UPI0038719E88